MRLLKTVRMRFERITKIAVSIFLCLTIICSAFGFVLTPVAVTEASAAENTETDGDLSLETQDTFGSIMQKIAAWFSQLFKKIRSIFMPEEVIPEILTVPEAPAVPEVDESDYTVYYFDSENGNDANDGLTQATAKQTLACASELVTAVDKPTKLLFKGGCLFKGVLVLDKYTATPEKPLLIGGYGEGKPLFDGDGNDAAIVLYGENARISGFDITNPKGRKGINVQTSKNGVTQNIVVENCDIHRVGWNWTYDFSAEEAAADIENMIDPVSVCPDEWFSFPTAGIFFYASEGDGINYRLFRNVWILNNTVCESGYAGIAMDSRWHSGNGANWSGRNKYVNQDNGWYPAENIVISGNDVSCVGGDGIVPIGVQDCWLEHNTVLHAFMLGRGNRCCAGLWPVSSRRVYVQYNEVGYTHLVSGCGDGQGFDIDLGCSDVVFRYNYAHDNAGGGMLLCNSHAMMPLYDENGNRVIDKATGEPAEFESVGNWDNVRISHNVFAYNGREAGNPAFLYISSDCKNAVIENNTIIMNCSDDEQQLIRSEDHASCGKHSGFVFRNNIIVNENEEALIEKKNSEDFTYENNLYYRFPLSLNLTTTRDWQALRFDPQITVPQDRTGYDKIKAYRPANPEAFQSGTYGEVADEKDAAGNDTAGKHYLGAFCE